MSITRLWLRDFRCFTEAQLDPDPHGLTVLHGMNGSGKSSVLEAIGWLATLRSIRGASKDAVVRRGTDRAIVRGETVVSDRNGLVEAEVPLTGASRAQLNRQPVRRRAQLTEALQVTVFSPADRRLVEGGPAERRDYLDDLLSERHARLEALVEQTVKVLRQRTALLRQSGGKPDEPTIATLDVWDARLATSGTALAHERAALATELEPFVDSAYAHLAGGSGRVSLSYRRSWEGDLLDALGAARAEDLRRQVTSVGPHRDELEITLGPSPARTHGSQGEQRCIALALRLGSHELRRRRAETPPVLLLDDVFSELDPYRSAALVELLPPGQVLLTTASAPPAAVVAGRVVEVAAGELLVSSAHP